MAARAPETLKPRHSVLVVDDEESTRLLLARLLSKELKVDVQLAGTCEQALRLAGNYAYDAILLDLLMPGIGGIGVLAAVRAASPNAATPVILVTQVAEKDTLDRCLAAGANAFHIKPIERSELLAILRDQLEARARKKNTVR